MNSTPARQIVIFSGGSAANSLVDVFNEVFERNKCSLSYVIPISDNGGSSSELIRVFGGPGIGDVRSRLVRLIPQSHIHILNLFNHRLPPAPEPAAAEFLTLLTGTSPLYASIATPQAMLIRSILSHLHLEILKRTRPPSSVFNFQSASIGNLFLTGARLFSGSFESAIYLLAIMGGVDESRTNVLPVIISNFSHHISAGLADGSVIAGQNAISHPSEPTALGHLIDSNATSPTVPAPPNIDTTIEDATLPGSLLTLRQPSIVFSKSHEQPLPARIERIWYINPYGQEMRPPPNPKVLDAISNADAIIYSIGSLYTSIVPSLILQGVGKSIAQSPNTSNSITGEASTPGTSTPSSAGPRFKILILNGTLDRETPNYTASDFLDAIVRACLESEGTEPTSHSATTNPDNDQTSNSPNNSSSSGGSSSSNAPYSTHWHKYITHVIHLDGSGTPKVDKALLAREGVESIRLYGRKAEDGAARYDGKALAQALGAILGRREKGERSRRNTGS